MAIKDKRTYGENYWALQVEAAAEFDEQLERMYAPYFARVIAETPEIGDLPAGIRNFIKALEAPASAGMGGFALGVGVEMIDEVLHTALEPAMMMMRRSLRKRSRETWLTPAETNILFQRNKVSHDFWELGLAVEGYEDVLSDFHYKAQLPYPSIPDLILYSRYHGDPTNVWGTITDFFNPDPVDFKLWEWLGLQRLTSPDVHTLMRRGLLSEGDYRNSLSEIGWSQNLHDSVKELGWTMPNAMLVVQGDLMQRLPNERILADISMADINPRYAKNYFDAILTKPASQDIIAYTLRIDPDLSSLDPRLRRIGIHPDYFPLYKELAHPIPPVADIITMAVREAFTPAIAAKFGQYEDLPPEYVAWVGKKGLSKDWAERYWASHWALPSPQQGFEMLHRGAINRGELDMLLRALDVMPFWRDKLTRIAYRRLTRVDIRRMYKAGVLTEAEVYESYIQHGYTEQNARRMTDFTVQWAAPKEASITRSDILNAYKSRMITRAEASDLLADMGEKYFHREFMLKAVDYKKALEFTETKIKGIRNLYRQRVYDENKTLEELLKLDLPAEEVEDLMTQWYYDIKEEAPRLWTTAQTLSFIKDGLITKERGIAELTTIGYDAEHIDVYMRTIE